MPCNLLSTGNTFMLPARLPLFIFIILFTGIVLNGCKNEWDSEKRHSIANDSLKASYITIADSISYGVVIKSREIADKWQRKWLSNLDRKEFVNFIFEGVYSGKLQPYDYFEDEPISIEQVRNLEKKEEFDRLKVGKIQFRERWYLDPEQFRMMKEVYAVMLAYEVYRDNGEFRGYKPAFRVFLNKSVGQ